MLSDPVRKLSLLTSGHVTVRRAQCPGREALKHAELTHSRRRVLGVDGELVHVYRLRDPQTGTEQRAVTKQAALLQCICIAYALPCKETVSID
jgi:hypothetical protein